MNADLIFKAFGEANSDYLIHAEQSMTSSRPMPNRGAKLRFSLIAAAIVAIVMIPLTVIIANHYGITPPPIPVITTPEETYKSLTDIPGAVKVDSSIQFGQSEPSKTTQPHPPEKLLEMFNKGNMIAFLGTASNFTTVIVKDDNSNKYWHISTMTLTIDERLLNADTLNKTIKAIFIYPYLSLNDEYRPINIYSDAATTASATPYGFYLLESDMKPFTLNGITYELSDYAEYSLYLRGDLKEHASQGLTAYQDGIFYLPIKYFYIKDENTT